jgi:hypothetical protein
MAYWLDEAWHRWTEIDEIGTAAAGLYSRCGAYIADTGTDGYIPAARARMYGTPEWIQRLVDVGLWTVEEDGFRDTRYFELNKSQEQIEAAKTAAATRQRKHQHAKKKPRSTRGNANASVTRDSPVSNTSDDAFPYPSPFGGIGAGKRPTPLRAVPDWCGRCNKNTRMAVGEDDRSHPCPDCNPTARAS